MPSPPEMVVRLQQPWWVGAATLVSATDTTGAQPAPKVSLRSVLGTAFVFLDSSAHGSTSERQANCVLSPAGSPDLISSLMASSCSCSIMARVCASEWLPGETTSTEPPRPPGPSSPTSEISGSLPKAGAAVGASTPDSGDRSHS